MAGQCTCGEPKYRFRIKEADRVFQCIEACGRSIGAHEEYAEYELVGYGVAVPLCSTCHRARRKLGRIAEAEQVDMHVCFGKLPAGIRTFAAEGHLAGRRQKDLGWFAGQGYLAHQRPLAFA